MKRLSTVVLGVFCFVTIQAVAENFNGEFEVGFFSGIIDRPAQEDDISGGSGSLTFYFSTVEAVEGPLAEANFLEKASNLSAGFSTINVENGTVDEDSTAASLNGRFIDKQRGVILDLGYSKAEVDNTDEEARTVSAGLGKYITDNITLVASYSSTTEDDGLTDEEDIDSWAIDFKMVGAFGKHFTYTAEAEAGVVQTDGEDGNILDLAFTAYPTRNIGVGGSYSYLDVGSSEVDSFEVFGEWFITGMFSVSAEYSFSQEDDSDEETQDFSVGAKIRF